MGCTSGANQYWGGILLTESSVVSASYLELRHSYHGIFMMKGSEALLVMDHARFVKNHFNIQNEPTPTANVGNSVLIEDSLFLDFTGNGVSSRGGEVTLQRVVIANARNAIGHTPRALRIRDDSDDNSYFAADHVTLHSVEYLVDNIKNAPGSLMSITNSIKSSGQLRGSYSDPMALSDNLYYNVSAISYLPEAGSMNENPLFVDPSENDLRVTHRSGALKPVQTGGAALGGLAFDGALTIKLMGHIYDSLTLGNEQDHFIEGDLIVEPSAELIIAGGTNIYVVQADLLRGGTNASYPELTIYGELNIQSTAETPVRFDSLNINTR